MEALEKQVTEEMKAKKDAELEAKFRSLLASDDSDDSDDGEPVESLQQVIERNLASRTAPFTHEQKEGGGLGASKQRHSSEEYQSMEDLIRAKQLAEELAEAKKN